MLPANINWPAPTPPSKIDRLAAQEELTERAMEYALEIGTASPAEIRRTFATLTQASRSLTALQKEEGEGSAGDIHRLLAEAARLVFERHAKDNTTGGSQQ